MFKKNGVSLVSAEPGSWVKIVTLIGGWGIRSRLEAMGFIPGEKIKIITNHSGHHIVVLVKNVQYFLRRGVAMKIIVE